MRFLVVIPLLFSSAIWADKEEDNVQQAEVILTATRLKQSVSDTPASVTVITDKDIERIGARNILEALTLVPGMQIATGGRYSTASYHGAFGAVARHLLILVDGMTAYRPGEARIEWTMLPVAMEDVQRIEVVRGPNAAAYGANAFTGVINIITKNPMETTGIKVRGSLGGGHDNVSVQMGDTLGDSAWRITAAGSQSDGRDDERDNQHTEHLHAAWSYAKDDISLALRGGTAKYDRQVSFVHPTQISFPDANESTAYFSAKFGYDVSNTQRLEVNANWAKGEQTQEWVSCIPAATLIPPLYELHRVDPTYAARLLAGQYPTGGSAEANALRNQVLAYAGGLGANLMRPMCGTTDQNFKESIAAIDVQDTLSLSDDLRLIVGVGYQDLAATAQTHLNGSEDGYVSRFFANAEWEPMQDWLFNVGAMYEKGDLSPSAFMPRAGLNVRLNDKQSVRFVYNVAERTPDIFEQKADWSYSLHNFNVNYFGSEPLRYYFSSRAAGDLENERIASSEIGWHYAGGKRTDFDVRVFHDRLTNLIGERLHFANFAPTNNGKDTQDGVELQGKVRAFGADWFAGYTYLENDIANVESWAIRRHAGFVGASFDIGEWNAMIKYTGGNAYNGRPSDFIGEILRDANLSKSSEDYMDVKIGNRWNIGDYVVGADIVVRHRFSEPVLLPTYIDDSETSAFLQFNIN